MAEQKIEVKVDIKALEAKIDKGEALTPDEEKFLMSDQKAPAEFQGNLPPVTDEKVEDGKDPGKDEGKTEDEIAAAQKEADNKAAQEKAVKDALISRAKAAGLPETATEAEIIAAEKKKEEEIDENDPFYRVEQLLQKEEKDVTEQDLEKYTKREKAYYYQMRRDRKARQDAEAARDAALFNLAKLKKDGKLPEEGKPEDGKDGKPPVEEEDPLKDREPTDFITIADLRALREKAIKNRRSGGGSILQAPVVQSFLKICDEKAAAEHADYEEVLELTEEIIKTNPDYQKQVVDALIKGENPALKTYELIKADPEFAKLYPAAQVRVKARKAKNPDKKNEEAPAAKTKTPEELKKEKEAQAAEDKLKENENKPKTSGHAEGKDKIEGTDLTIEQIAAMSDREFSKLPKKVRERYLQLYG